MAAKRRRRSGEDEPNAQDRAQTPVKSGQKSAQQSEGGGIAKRPSPPIPLALLNDTANVFRLLSDQSRLRLVLYLTHCGEQNVSAICERLQQTQPAVSHHLALLRVSGAIEARRAGKNIFYSVRSELFNDLLVRVLSSFGTIPKKAKLNDFTLTYAGR